MTESIPGPSPIGPVLQVGDPMPPSTANKAVAAAVWGGVPAILGGILDALDQADVLFPDAPQSLLAFISLLLILVSPIAGYYGAYRTPNKLLVAVQTVTAAVEPSPGP